jgi:hypothetical protein
VAKRVTRVKATPQNTPAAQPLANAPAKAAPIQSAVMTTPEE